MIKKILSVFFSAVIIFSMCIPIFAEKGVTLSVSNAEVYAGEEFTVQVSISDNSRLAGAVINLNYDGSMLQYVSSNKGGIINDSAQFSLKNFSNNKNSYIRMAYLDGESSITAEGVLFTVKFKALESAKGRSSISINIASAGDFTDCDLNKLPFSVENGNVIVNNDNYIEPSTEPAESNTDVNSTTVLISSTTSEDTTSYEPATDEKNIMPKSRIYIAFIAAFLAVAVVVAVVIIFIRKGRKTNEKYNNK